MTEPERRALLLAFLAALKDRYRIAREQRLEAE